MTMAWVWTGMVVIAAVFSLVNGSAAALGPAALAGARAAVELTLSLAGPMLLWCGVMEILHRSGASDALGRGLRGALRRLYPSARRDRELCRELTANLTANLLGLGSAATPAGIRAAGLLEERGSADELCRLVVMNTASIQLFPATAAALRSAAGSAAPLDLLPAVWVTSALALTAGLLAERLLRR